MKKYELTDDTITVNGSALHRIRALKDFGDVKAGELGGFVESEENLSQEGNCWVYDDAKVLGKVKVYDNAKVYGDAQVRCIHGDVQVCGNARVFEDVNLIGGDLILAGHRAW